MSVYYRGDEDNKELGREWMLFHNKGSNSSTFIHNILGLLSTRLGRFICTIQRIR